MVEEAGVACVMYHSEWLKASVFAVGCVEQQDVCGLQMGVWHIMASCANFRAGLDWVSG